MLLKTISHFGMPFMSDKLYRRLSAYLLLAFQVDANNDTLRFCYCRDENKKFVRAESVLMRALLIAIYELAHRRSRYL